MVLREIFPGVSVTEFSEMGEMDLNGGMRNASENARQLMKLFVSVMQYKMFGEVTNEIGENKSSPRVLWSAAFHKLLSAVHPDWAAPTENSAQQRQAATLALRHLRCWLMRSSLYQPS